MSRYKVSYGRCAKSTFLNKKNRNQLVPGRLYFIKDTGQILRANSVNTYDSYSDQLHVVDDFPAANEYIEGHIYLKKIAGDTPTVRAKVMDNGIVYEVQCTGSGSSGGSVPMELTELISDVAKLKSQLQWKNH